MGRFEPGNQAALKHGGRSPRCRQEARLKLRAEMRALILAGLPPELPPGDLLLVDVLETAMADVRQLREWIDAHGGPTGPGRWPVKPFEMLHKREGRALELMDRLGFGPRSRSQIMASLGSNGQGLAGMLAGRRAIKSLEVANHE